MACPVTANIHVQVTDRSWSYFQVAFMNHRIPVRNLEIRAADGGAWQGMNRVWGAVWALNHDSLIEGQASGAVLRVTSALERSVESPVVLTEEPVGSTIDLEVQFDTAAASGESCPP